MSRIDSSAFVLFKYQRPVGRETYRIRRDSAGSVLEAASSSLPLGSAALLRARLQRAADLTATSLTVAGATSSMTDVDAFVEVTHGQALIRQRRDTTHRPVAGQYFLLTPYAPFALEEALLQYWEKRGRPATLQLLPQGTAAISVRGRDTFRLQGRNVVLERLTVRGVIWGAQTVWRDARGLLIAAVGADAELDRVEAVREGFEPLLAEFVRTSVRDAVNDLAHVARTVRPVQQGTYAITGVRLIDGTGAAPVDDAVLVIADGRIRWAGPRVQAVIPRGTVVVDGRGKTAIPGLWDMHGHYAQGEWLAAGLAAGVTTVRDMANEIELITALRDAVRAGRALGPRVLAAGVIDGGQNPLGVITADTPEQARRAVARYHAEGFQQIKIYESLAPALVPVIVAEAHRLGMPVTGHVPAGMNAVDFVRAGADGITHLNFVQAVLRPASGPGQPLRAVDTESPEAKRVIALLVERGTVVEPSLARREQRVHPKDSSFERYEPGSAKAPPELRDALNSVGVPAAAAERARAGFAGYVGLFGMLYRAGIRMTLGTDLVVPGHTIHRELELAVEAGLTPLEAIRLATQDAARVMGLAQESGTLQRGMRADVVLISGNPAANISAVRNVHAVVTGGRMYLPAPLWRHAGFVP
ncbi:MAG: amidohydrolase family protein [Gemmatimonadota bacterium]